MPSKRNPVVYFLDILRAIELIEQYVSHVSLPQYKKNIEKQDAVTRRLEVLAEASCRLREEDKKLCSEQDWKAIRGLGNRFRHEYDAIDLEIVWSIIHRDLPVLKATVEQTLGEHFPDVSRS
jgi:uncharacterized protein with HEPN domain